MIRSRILYATLVAGLYLPSSSSSSCTRYPVSVFCLVYYSDAFVNHPDKSLGLARTNPGSRTISNGRVFVKKEIVLFKESRRCSGYLRPRHLSPFLHTTLNRNAGKLFLSLKHSVCSVVQGRFLELTHLSRNQRRNGFQYFSKEQK